MYKQVLRPMLFRMDPEHVHDMITRTGSLLGHVPGARDMAGHFLRYENPMLEQEVLGIKLANPIGLAAGFDKDAVLTDILYYIGFGFEEIGSVTGDPCEGNPKPRLFRLPKDKSLVVNYGLKSEGSEKIYDKLKNKKFKFPVGVSIAKINKDGINTKDGIADYVKAFKKLHCIGSYTTINISCPNTSDGRSFCHPDNLQKLLKEINKFKIKNPIFLKIKPDLTSTELGKTLAIINKFNFVSGLIVSNLSKNRENLKTPKKELSKVEGGISGLPTREKSNQLIKQIYKKTKGKYIIIGCGGVFTAEDAYEKIKLGSSLVQLITGMVYEGPAVVKNINKGLVELLKKDGFKNISEAVGSGI
ncbi:MAG: quinone-dependent dihydroorotate dehydrogenase [Candidatus Aenigmatarchaeota archaeon]